MRYGFALAAACFLLADSLPACAQAWSPGSRWVAVGGPSLHYISQAAPGNSPAFPLPDLPPAPMTGPCAFPAWSPDGNTLAYVTPERRLMLLDVQSGKTKRAAEGAYSPPRWSPDSKTFAVVCAQEDGGRQLLLLYRDGGAALRVDLPFAALNLNTRGLAWVPTTDNVILAAGEGDKSDLYLIEQGQIVRLTTSGDILGFAVSGNGKKVIWARRSRNARYILFSLYELELSSRKLRKLPFPDRLPAVNPDPRNAPEAVQSVVFSPDLRHLAFITQGGPGAGIGGAALFLGDIAGRSARALGRGVPLAPDSPTRMDTTGWTFPAMLPAFSPDSRSLAAVKNEAGQRSLLVFSLAGGEPQRIPLP